MRNVLFLPLLIQLFTSVAIDGLGSVEFGLLFELSQCVVPNGPSNQMVFCTEFGIVLFKMFSRWYESRADVNAPLSENLNKISVTTK